MKAIMGEESERCSGIVQEGDGKTEIGLLVFMITQFVPNPNRRQI